jgi:hypothetical protein
LDQETFTHKRELFITKPKKFAYNL